jgi:hypothetical protein
MKPSFVALLLIGGLLSACTSREVQYCSGFGVEGTSEYGNCLDYYHRQEAAFGADRAVCDAEADKTYPASLYDYGGYTRTHGGIGYGGRWYGGHSIYIEPDYRRNRELDRLRMRIIEPCMQARGWNSGKTWQAGRRAVKPSSRKSPAPSGEKLPWL